MLPLVALVLLQIFNSTGSADQKVIHLRHKTITSEAKARPAISSTDETVSGLFLIQFTNSIRPEWRAELEQEGVRLLRFVPDDAFVARLAKVRPSQINAHSFVQTIEPYRGEFKVHSALTPNAARGAAPAQLQIRTLLSPDATPQELAEVRRLLQKVDKESVHRFGNVVQGTVTQDQLNALADSPSVLWIEPAPKIKLFDEIASKVVGGDDGDSGTPTATQQLGYDGTGVKVAVADSGLMEGDAATMHPDLAGRVDAFFFYGGLTDAADEHSHGTHVTGIIGGNAAAGEMDDNGFLYGLGVAPGAHIIAQRIFDGAGGYEAPPSFEGLTHDAVRAGAVIGSNSWGDDTQGRYDLSAAEFDELVRDADSGTAGDQPYILEFSAGNAGPGEQTIGSPAVAKNVIASGAVENNRFDLFIYDSGQETMADFSSRGPCEDGRIKPDVVAAGTWIASLRSSLANDDNAWAPISANYLYQGGTSQSGPHVSGAAAVFVQYYRANVTNGTPSPALVKAALVNSAVAMDGSGGTGPVPNNDEGWGRVDLTEIIGSARRYNFIDQSVLLTNRQTFEKSVLVAGAEEPLKITLTYTDVPGFPAAIPALVNDLDLEVVGPDGRIYHGNQFENGESVAGAPAFDNINNVEAVQLPNPVPGEYLVRIRAKNLVEDARRDTSRLDQDFALVVSGDLSQPGVGILFFDKKSYAAPGVMKLKLVDFDLAGQPSISVRVNSSTETAGEIFVLNAAGSGGAFTGNVALATSAFVGQIQVSHNDTITATYQDASPAGARQAIARADLFAPIISNISVTNRFGRMVISWQTDEPATSIVRFGTNSGLSSGATNLVLSVTHEVTLGNLAEGATYQFLVISADEAGNTRTNNNDGALFNFVAVKAGIILLVDAYTDPFFAVPPLSGYTDALNQIGLSYQVWNVATNGSPTLNDLQAFKVVIWRLPEFDDTFSATQRAALTNYLNGGGSLLVASMEVLSRLDAAGGGAFRTNVLHVASYTEDAGVPAIAGAQNDPVTSGIDLDLDYSVYEDDFKDLFGIPSDVSDTLLITTNAAPILFDSSWGGIAGVRFPRIGQDSPGRVAFLSFPLDAVPSGGADPNNRANLLRNLLSFLVPGADGLGNIALDNSSYTIPSLVTVEVGDSDLAGAGQTTATFFSDSATNGQTVTLSETPRRGLFRGFITLVSRTNNFQAGELRAQSGDTIRAQYFDVSSGGIAQVVASVDTLPATITNISASPDYEEAVVNWTTSKPTDALVQFGESTFLGRTGYRPNFESSHSVELFGLEPDRVYYFQVTSRDAAGNVTTDDNHGNFYTFKTLKAFSTPYFENFENRGTNWIVLDGEAGTTSWKLGRPNNGLEGAAHSPTNAWGSNLDGTSIDLGDTTLVSPAIDLSGGNQATLRFWHSYDFTEQTDSDIYEMGQIYVSTNNGNAWSVVAEFADTSFGWIEEEVDLSAYLGHVIRVGFYYGFFSLENSNHPGWLVDDIAIVVTNAAPQFTFKSVAFTNGQAYLTFVASPAGSQYVIEASTNLVN
ncbi:MAG: S8 family serine peptidase, partial [Verrucomicrobiota bacterium]